MHQAAIQVLQRRWSLPDSAVPIVERFFLAWSDGHTSLTVSIDEAELLSGLPAVSDGRLTQKPTPLVLRGRSLQSWSLAQAEIRVAHNLRRLLEDRGGNTTLASHQDILRDLFPDGASPQRLAAETCLRSSLTLLTGGPGTGKTTVTARMLALLGVIHPHARMALAAPTGKAAARLGEVIDNEASQLEGAVTRARPKLAEAASRARTVHGLVGWNPKVNFCRFHSDSPLPFDVVVIDEASMLDLLLWDHLLQSLAPGTRLIVVGDHRQLASVQPGRVLGEMVAAAQAGPLTGCHVELTRNYRFAPDHGIGRLASAIRDHDGPKAIEVLGNTDFRNGLGHYPSNRVGDALEHIWSDIRRVVQSTTPTAALKALAKVRILCALREGPYGVEGINGLIEAKLRREGFPAGRWAHGRPILVTANDPHCGLYNGDLGVLLADKEGSTPTAWFSGASAPRGVPVAALRNYNTAWGLTVHRSQGSEFDTVLLVLPPAPHQLCGPELFYTAVTRARAKLLVAANDSAVIAASQPRPHRRTELLRALYDLREMETRDE